MHTSCVIAAIHVVLYRSVHLFKFAAAAADRLYKSMPAVRRITAVSQWLLNSA